MKKIPFALLYHIIQFYDQSSSYDDESVIAIINHHYDTWNLRSLHHDDTIFRLDTTKSSK